MRPGELLAFAILLLGLAVGHPDPRTPWLVVAAATVAVRRSGVSWPAWARALAAPLPFLLLSVGSVAAVAAMAPPPAAGGTPASLALLVSRALRAQAAAAAVAMAACTVPPAVAASLAVRLRVPPPAVDVLVLAARLITRVGGELRARVALARRRGGTRSWRSRLRTAGWLAASLAGLCHRRALQVDAVYDSRGPVLWSRQGACIPLCAGGSSPPWSLGGRRGCS